MHNTQSRGFTIIELLVVIAIIGILSAVVLASLNTARTKGQDASIQSNIDTVRTQATVYFDNHNYSYNTTGTAVSDVNCGTTFTANTMLSDSNIQNALVGAYSTSGGSTAFRCNISATGANYAIAVPLATANSWWCTDSAVVSRGGYASKDAALSDGSDYTCN